MCHVYMNGDRSEVGLRPISLYGATMYLPVSHARPDFEAVKGRLSYVL